MIGTTVVGDDFHVYLRVKRRRGRVGCDVTHGEAHLEALIENDYRLYVSAPSLLIK
ncbi:hypothetical protein RM844_22360 [Streptomyces sp. DSM 44915]|uniref:Transposase n=1 Tax=Streptomyces chisholmiae TaxID=3075540 RepID=A0ABU2JXV7_9ACTN|nr:hypothetical protein [Streptomyces sp. DSM 44915]MDT0269033.1 hypothetical protein [Streptomyces sp. DSM 44915]